MSRRRQEHDRAVHWGAVFPILLIGLTVAIGQPRTVAARDPSSPGTAPTVVWPAARDDGPVTAARRPSIRSRYVSVDFERLATLKEPGASMHLEVFDDAAFVAVVDRVVTRSPQRYSLLGHLAGGRAGTFALAVHHNAMVADIHMPGSATFQVRYLGDGIHIARDVDETAFPPCGVGLAEAPRALAAPGPLGQRPGGAPTSGACQDDGSVIDVLVVYTDLARQASGGTEGMNARIDLAIAEMNESLQNAQISTTVEVVWRQEVDYVESGRSQTDLDRLVAVGDGFLDEVHDLRDELRADIVSLIANTVNYCGLAKVSVGPGNTPRPDRAFNVVRKSCMLAPTYTFAHELGHNLGSGHDWTADPCSDVAFPYAYGYYDPGDAFATIMGSQTVDRLRVPYFSNPSVYVDGRPTGRPAHGPEPANNALAFSQTRLSVANFRNRDCNGNGVCDDVDIAGPTSDDCNENAVPDECERDCNGNGTPDTCDLAGAGEDCNENGVPDECEVDCNQNDVPDDCDIAGATSLDDNGTGMPDECEPPILFVDASAVGLNRGTSWSDAYTELRDALAIAARAGGAIQEVWVATGTYTPGVAPDRKSGFPLTSGVSVYGGFSGGETSVDQRDPQTNVTILSGDLNDDDNDCCYLQDGPGCGDPTCATTVCEIRPSCCDSEWSAACVERAGALCDCRTDENSYHVVIGSGADQTALLDGFTVTAGNADQECLGGTTGYGGGMHNFRGSPTVVGCLFQGNTAYDGGGVSAIEQSTPAFLDCEFARNFAFSTGGGARLTGGLSFTRCRFINNASWGSGGAVTCFGYAPSFTNCLFRGNYARINGGAISRTSLYGSSPTVTNCVFNGNRAGELGGVASSWNASTATFVNCTFSGNTAASGGGAIADRHDANTNLINCTFSGNSGGARGGAVYQDNAVAQSAANCVFWDNTPEEVYVGDGSTMSITYSVVRGGWPGEG
ncbi:MAG: hypothetical protein JSU86_13210, partial [Phycisphaerales bacterium]